MNKLRILYLSLTFALAGVATQASATEMVDTLENCSTIFPMPDTLVQQVACGQKAKICTNISLEEADIYEIDINGTRLEEPNFCVFDTLGYYPLTEAILEEELAPYFVEAWRVNNQIFSGEFLTVQGLINAMNEWDPEGNWQFDAEQNRIVGGEPSNLYSVLQIEIILTRTTQILSFQQEFTPSNIAILLPPGQYEIVATNTLKACRDTLLALIACTQPDTVQLILEEGLTRTVCLRGNEFLTEVESIEQTGSENDTYTWSYAGSDCIRFTGSMMGRDTAQFVLCDSLKICDTVLVYISTRSARSRQASDSIALGQSGMFCLQREQLALPGLVTRFENACADSDTIASSIQFDFNSLCLHYKGAFAGKDTVCVGMCDTYGNCDTLEFELTIVQPKVIYDTVFLRVDTLNSCLERKGLEGDELQVSVDYQSVGVEKVQFDVDSSAYCVSYSGQQVGTDSLYIWLSDNFGNLNLSIIYVTVVQPTAIEITDTIYVNESVLFCPSDEELPGSLEHIFNDCPAQAGSPVNFSLDEDFCMTYTGLKLGAEKACIVLCDDLGFCDTTFFSIFVEEAPFPPDAVPDTASTTQPNPITIAVQSNDNTLGGIIEIILIEKPDYGRVFINGNGTLTYEPALDVCEGQDRFRYAICNPTGCDTATVNLTINCAEVEIFNAVSPNGDGINDTFFINNIQARPDNRLQIYNRWGNLVFDRKGYQNDWDGTWNGKNLPDGTYFYILELREDGQRQVYRGYLELHR